MPEMVYDCVILSFKRFLPAGIQASGEPNSPGGIRPKDLVQLRTDPGGQRVLAVEEIRLKDPRRRKQ